MDECLHECNAKGVESPRGQTPIGGLLSARRGRLVVGPESLRFGNRVIPYSEVEEALYVEYRQLFVPAAMLVLTTGSRTWRFGFRPATFWRGELPFAVRRVRGRVRLALRMRIAAGVALLVLAIVVAVVVRSLS